MKVRERKNCLVKGERVARQEMRMICWSAITLRAGVMLHGGIKEKETRIDRDNERTRGGIKKRMLYVCVRARALCAIHTHVHTQRSNFNVHIGCTRTR